MTNLMDIDNLVQFFFQEREQGLKTLQNLYLPHKDQLSFRALKKEMQEELKTGCTTFFNKNYPIDELNNYLFYIANAFCKRLNQEHNKQKTEYICPACLYLGKECLPLSFNRFLQCSECIGELSITTDPKRTILLQTFSKHNKKGCRCPDCQRFIPLPMDNIISISCPYFDCCFVGKIQEMKKMHHPTSKHNPETIILDDKSCWKNNIPTANNNAETQYQIVEELQNDILLLKEIIETQSNAIPYCSANASIRHKQYIYQAFSKLIDQYPHEMTGYLFQTSTNHNGFQHKVFQEYIKLLETSLPFNIIKHKKDIQVKSLLDNSLCLFDGISVFESKITDKLTIKNETKEFYIGGRKATYTKPYYIGKLLNVIKKDDKTSLLSQVKEYSFSKIQMVDIDPETEVIATHLRIVPHYESGQMKTINRIRKKIVERAKELK